MTTTKNCFGTWILIHLLRWRKLPVYRCDIIYTDVFDNWSFRSAARCIADAECGVWHVYQLWGVRVAFKKIQNPFLGQKKLCVIFFLEFPDQFGRNQKNINFKLRSWRSTGCLNTPWWATQPGLRKISRTFCVEGLGHAVFHRWLCSTSNCDTFLSMW